MNWKKIDGFNYHVSDTGLVKNINGKILKPEIMKKGYHRIDFGKGGKIMVHRLVAMAFIPNTENKPQVNHVDGDKDNNCVSNLEWVTNNENKSHAVKNGLTMGPKGELAGASKLKESDVLTIRFLQSLGYGPSQYNINKSTVKRIKSNRSWSHVAL